MVNIEHEYLAIGTTPDNVCYPYATCISCCCACVVDHCRAIANPLVCSLVSSWWRISDRHQNTHWCHYKYYGTYIHVLRERSISLYHISDNRFYQYNNIGAPKYHSWWTETVVPSSWWCPRCSTASDLSSTAVVRYPYHDGASEGCSW